MSKVNTITFCRSSYNDEIEWEMAIESTVTMLLRADYIMTVRNEEKGLGIVSIDFETDKREYGGAYPYWLEPEEVECVVWNSKGS
jgi:hypothetical protein